MQKIFSWVMIIALVLGAAVMATGSRVVDDNEVCTRTVLGKVDADVVSKGYHIVNFITTSYQCFPTQATFFQTGNNENPDVDYWDYAVEIKTSDGQTGKVTFNILYSVIEDQAVMIRTDIAKNAKDFNQKVIANLSRSVPRDVAAGYTADGLYATKRADYSLEVEDILREEVAELGGYLISFELRDVQFSEQYEASIEAQQIAQEAIETATFDADRKKQEAIGTANEAQGIADAAIITANAKAATDVINADGYALATVTKAEADAKALELVASAIRSNPDLLMYEYIQKLAPTIDVIMLPSNGEYILPLPEVK